MADLSVLFNKQEPSGMMAGVQQGISNARSLMDLEKLSADTRAQEFELDKNKQMLPYELQIKKGLGAQGEQDASQPMLDNRLTEATAKAQGAQYDTWKKVLSMDNDELTAMFTKQHTQMVGTINQLTTLAASGASGKDLVPYLDRMSEKLSPEQQATWKQQRSKYMMYSSGQAYQELMKMQEGINNMSPEMLKEKAKQQAAMALQRLQNSGSFNTAVAGRAPKDVNSSYQQEIVRLTRQLATMQPNDPMRPTLEAQVKFLEQKDLARMSSATGMEVGPDGMPRVNKIAGGGQQQITKPTTKWVKGSDGIMRKAQ